MTFSPEKGGWISPDRGASPTHEGNRNVLPADYVPPENPYLPKFDHEFGESAAWDVGSCERRCDGDRVTEYVKASDMALHARSRQPRPGCQPAAIQCETSPCPAKVHGPRSHA